MTNLTENSKAGHIRIGSSSSVDFAFWVLLKDGLHVPAFDKHAGGNQILQSLGMNAEGWHSWLKLILIRHDSRLLCCVSNINVSAEEKVEAFKQFLGVTKDEHNVVCDQEWHDSQHQFYSHLLTEQEQSYQESLADYQGLDLNFIKQSNPPELWQGNLRAKEALVQLWHDYQLNQHSNKFIESVLLTPKMWDVEANPPTQKYLQIYLVDYPYEIEVFIPPIFVLVTVRSCPVDQSRLEQRMFKIVRDS